MSRFAYLWRSARALVVAAPIALVAACGGGGGGGDDEPVLSLSAHHVEFSAPNAGSNSEPDPVTVSGSVDGASGTVYLFVEVNSEIVRLGQLSPTGPTSGEFAIYPAEPSLVGPGNHKATVTIHACGDSNCIKKFADSPQQIDIDYTVAGLVTSQQELQFRVGNTVVAADLSKEIAVDGYPAANWTATSNVDWLVTSRKAGNSATTSTLTAKIDETVLDSLNNGHYTGKVTLTPEAGDPVEITTTLDVERTEARLVSPGTEVAGTAMEVTVRGDNFDAVTVTGIRFGDTTATTFRVVSPTEIRATHLALPAGSYPITVENTGNLGRSLASMSVVAPLSTSTIAIAHPPATPYWYPIGVVYDAPRQALLVGLVLNDGSGKARILRYTHDGASWQGPAQFAVDGGLTSLTLSQDGKQLLVGQDSAVILQFDPATLSLLNTSEPGGAYFEYLSTMPLTSDGYVLGPVSMSASGYSSVLKYSVRAAAFVDYPEGLNLMGNGGTGVASADGSTILMGNNPYNGDLFQLYDASTGDLKPVHVTDVPYGMATDRTGSRFIVGNSGIYDRNLSLLGRLPENMSNVVMSRDGNRVYALDFDRKLWSFSLGEIDGSFTLTQLGAPATLVQDPSPSNGAEHYPTLMTINPDGGTLFIVGTKCTIVMPVH